MNGSFFGAGYILPVPKNLNNNTSTPVDSTLYANGGIITTTLSVTDQSTINGDVNIQGNSAINGNAFYNDGLQVTGNIFVNGTTTSSFQVGTIMMYAGSAPPTGWLLCNGASLDTVTYPNLFNIIKYNYGGSGLVFNIPDMRGRIPIGADSGANRITANNTLGAIGGEEKHVLTTNEIPIHNHGNIGSAISASSHNHNITSGSGISTSDGNHTHTFNGLVSDHNHGIKINYFNDTSLPPAQSSTNIGVILSNAIDFEKSDLTVRETNNTFTSFNATASFDGQHTHTINTSKSYTTSPGTHSHSFTTFNSGSSTPHNNMQPYQIINYIIKST